MRRVVLLLAFIKISKGIPDAPGHEESKLVSIESQLPSDLIVSPWGTQELQEWAGEELGRLPMPMSDVETTGMTRQDLATGYTMNFTGFLPKECDVGYGQ